MIGAREIHLVVLPHFERGESGWRRVLRELQARSRHPIRLDDLVRPAIGKPCLRPMPGTVPLEFNLSHSGDTALLAIARDSVGVDLEMVEPEADLEGVAEQFFSGAERTALPARRGAARTDAIYRTWVRKEAYLKARGRDLGSDLVRECTEMPEQRWSILDCPLELDHAHHAAVATSCRQPRLIVTA